MSLLSALRARFHRPHDTVARWIALTTMAAMLTSLGLYSVFSVVAGVWARPPILETGLMERVASITRIINAAPVDQRPTLTRAATDKVFNVQWLRRHEDALLPEINDPGFNDGQQLLRDLLEMPAASIEAYEPDDWADEHLERPYTLIIQLPDGSWVQFSVPTRRWGLDPFIRNLIVIVMALLSTLIVALIATRHLATPLERFAQGARRFGKDFRAPPIAVVGPHEIRQAILAFNAMQAQIQHFLNDRTQMLAAISHDLRAPLTRMRLRGEFIEDAEQQTRLFRDVDEMQAMVNSALDFFRDDARLEPATAFDLAELLLTVVDDFKDAGTEVTYEGPARLVHIGRPIGLKRALSNLVDNAIKYGGEAGVRLQAEDDRVQIQVIDRGPGIASEYQEQVFTPFFRIEGSRNKNTGGVGLGLPTARATVLEHGGSLTLQNRTAGGLKVRVVLPVS
jgi:signal transduction histidine kinase